MLRSVVNQKFYTAINVLCLSVGIAFALLIGVFIAGELEVNKNLKDVNQLFFVQNKVEGQNSSIEFFTPPILTKMAADQFPTVFENYYRFWERNITVSKVDKHFRLQCMMGDQSFLDIFGFTVLHGDHKTPLHQPDCIIITQGVARQFFGKEDAVNETLSISTEQRGVKEYKITAVIAEPDKKNTVSDLMNMNAQIFLPLENAPDFLDGSDPDIWQDGIIAYIKLTPQSTLKEAQVILNKLVQDNAPGEVSENRTIRLSPLADYYLLTNHGAVLKLILSLGVIVVFILILAITNFINISIASSFARLKEVGIRKVIGGIRSQLIAQFLLESLTLAFVSAIFSLGLYQVLYPLFNGLLSANLPSALNFKSELWIWISGGTILIGTLAGIYPALFQSATRPIESLKGKSKSVQGTISFSRALIAIQFIITVFIFIGAIVLSRQTTYFLDRDLGYDESHVINVYSVPRIWNEEGFQKMDAARDAFLESSRVIAVSLSWGSPAWGMGGYESTLYKSETSIESGVQTSTVGVDEAFDEVYQMRLVEGDFLFPDRTSWKQGNLVLNESARDALDAKLGDKLKISGFEGKEFTLSGIVKDFNYESLHEAVKPVALIHNRDYKMFRCFSFRLEPADPAGSIAEVERLWKKVFPDEPLTYFFEDEKLQALYTTEIQLKKASTVATVLMLIIVMTGILGLVSLNVTKRNNEIGIRKVLGASISSILVMLSKEYAVLLISSFVLAVPLAFYFTSQWLNTFVYHIELSWWMFAIPALLLLIITLLMVILQSYKTAVTDPVKSLKYE